MKTELIKILEQLTRRKIARRSPQRGADLFANIDQIYGKNNFRVIFDVGANVGQSVSRYRLEFPNAEIYSFEPVSKTFQQLKTNVGALPGVQLFQFGFGSCASSVSINLGLGENSQLSSILYNVGSESEVVEIITLDEFVEQNELEVIDLLKIDTEGYELEVLKGAHDMLSSQRIGLIYIEAELMHSSRHFLSIEELNDVLKGYGYTIFGIYDQQPGSWVNEHSIFFCNVLYIAPKLIGIHVNPNSYPYRANIFRST